MKKTITLLLTLLFLNVLVVYAQDIDIGMEAINRDSRAPAGTLINRGNPANASGKITSVEIYANSDLKECKVATFYETDTNKFSTRDYEAIGTVTAGSKQTFTVDLDVVAGDYLGIYYSGGYIEFDTFGVGYWYIFSADHIPCTEQAFTYRSSRTISLYGTGTTITGLPVTFNGATISKWNTAKITKWNGVE